MSKKPVSNTGGPEGVSSEGLSSEGTTTAGDPTVITIAVVVCYDASGVVQVRVTDPIFISPGIYQKVRWCVYNNLSITLTSVSIGAFTSGGSTAAMLCSNTPNLTTGPISPGNIDAVCTEFCVAAPSPSGTSFQYTVSVKPEGQNDVSIHGPRVIIQ
jgi:hypothetical protein